LNWEHTQPDSAPIVMGSDLQDAVATEVYGMGVFKYGDAFIGLVQHFENRPENVFLDIQLAVSHDGNVFKRVGDRSPFIANGGVGDWDRFNTAVANNPPIEDGDDLRFYYSDRRYRHGPYDGDDSGPPVGGIGFATIKRDRFVAMEGNYEGGVITTKHLIVAGETLHLNARAEWGEVLVEAIDNAGDILATAKPIQEDGLNIPLVWETPMALDKGPVQLRITVKNGQLYSLWCE
jgi:hypothetical protein